jgi:uncharacterized protein (TIGR02569 family)
VTAEPPEQLLAAFRADHRDLRPLSGGQGTAWGAGSLVFKPLDMSLEALAWQEQVLGAVTEAGFRLARPVRTPDGRLAVAGWSAWQRVDGEHLPRRWAQICAAGERFHRATAGIPVPAWHRRRSDPFARADQAAWDGAVLAEFTTLDPVARLAGQLRPVGGRAQLIHGDLSGNVLFHPGLPPAIIDLSPYWRPPVFATAVVVIDAMIWEGADRSVLSIIDGQPDAHQCLLRAAIFRVVMHHLCNPREATPPPWWPVLLRAVAEVCDLAARQPGSPERDGDPLWK